MIVVLGLLVLAGALALAGAGIAIGIVVTRAREQGTIAQLTELRESLEAQRAAADAARDGILQAALAQVFEGNRAVMEQVGQRQASELDGKKSLIDQQLATMTGELGKVETLVRSIEGDRKRSFGELTNELRRQHEGIDALNTHTQQLREALANSKVRGQWGERMAEDVLRLAGLLEGVNYRKQSTLEASGGRPDYTFLLPNQLVMHMDVKFPLDNYLRYLDSANEMEQRKHRDQFLRDVRDRVKELNTRGYLDARNETVDCLLLFIPNEQVYGFIQEHDRALLDDALRNKIVLCSPLTLYATLAVVRQAVDNFRLEKTSNEILALLTDFATQWEKYVVQLDKVQQRFDQVAKEYTALMSTRHRALQRPLDKIEALRHDDLALVDAPTLALDA